ncbi:NUDIX domain-containing protein [Candidatus Pacearchaeota archaeon]|nr:NUDIX domain-containing protein [Candidatus Pacearchaeota archaeon]
MITKVDKNLMHYVVVTGILVKDGKFLIAKRADWEKVHPKKWTVPGGKMEVLDYALKPKDTSSHWYNVVENILRKEVKEEVNLEIKNIGYVTSLVYIRPDNIPCLIISMFAEPVSDEIKLCPALTEFVWVNLEEAKNYDLIEGIYEELEILDGKLKGGEMKEWTKSQ